MQLPSAPKKPTMYFIGVTTSKSSIMKVFPLWAKELELGDVELQGIDLPLHAPSEEYRQVINFMKEHELCVGALVTTHKIDLFDACRDMFDYIDPFAEKLNEVSSLSKNDGKFCAYAKDPVSSGLALEQFVPAGFWKEHGGSALLIGAGGSSLAMSLYFSLEKHADNVPKNIIIANRSVPRLQAAEKMLDGLNPKIKFSFEHGPSPADNDRLVGSLPQYSLIVNATGLGKDAPGSPTTDAVVYPENCLVWEINYRGDLIFMRQAVKQAEARKLHVEDGWNYFVHGWTQVMSDVFHIEIVGERLKKLSDIAAQVQNG